MTTSHRLTSMNPRKNAAQVRPYTMHIVRKVPTLTSAIRASMIINPRPRIDQSKTFLPLSSLLVAPPLADG